MKKQLLFWVFLELVCLVPNGSFAQSTQGTDFWVTLLRGDGNDYDELSLTFSAKKATKVYVQNETTGLKDTFYVGDNSIVRDTLCYKVRDDNDNIIETHDENEVSCYVTSSLVETPVYRALHVTSDEPISLIAANYKNKSFDVASILPTTALMSEYRIQCYTPTVHKNTSQGSHFAIVAAEDNVVVDITPTIETSEGHAAGVTYSTELLKKGQVYYVWSGDGSGDSKDFTGTVVKARDHKKIAVFNGNVHTCISNSKPDRDHIYSQAMPVNYWGKRFAITSSLTTMEKVAGFWERIDKIRVQALVDGTVVKIDGEPVHTFDFENGSNDDKKHFYEFDFGVRDSQNEGDRYQNDGSSFFEGGSHYIETSCPCAVHLFMTSNQYDHKKISGNDKLCNGDPSEIWVNPIEQRIDTLTFGVFETKQVTDHFINIVTLKENVASVRLDGEDISDKFQDLNGNPDYVFARIKNVEDKAHTLTADSGFVAHVYGFGQRESYGYPAGGRTKDLTAFITINGTIYRAGDQNVICGGEADSVTFGCLLNYDYDSILWHFEEGHDTITYPGTDSIKYAYAIDSVYQAYARIYRHYGEEDECPNFDDSDSISFLVNIGTFKVDIKGQRMPECTKEGDQVDFRIYLDNPRGVNLKSDSVKLTFTQTAIDDGFKEEDMTVDGDTMLIIPLPAGAKDGVPYGLHLHIGSQCESSTLEKDLEFKLKFAKTQLIQRYDNILGLAKDSFLNQTLSNFVWFHNGDTIENQITSVLHLDKNEVDPQGEYKVCYTIHEEGQPDIDDCTCPVRFETSTKGYTFDDENGLTITATYSPRGNKVFVNASWGGKTEIECYAEWIDVSGRVVDGKRFDIPDGGCTIDTPADKGFYILRVNTDGGCRSFKMFINQ